MRRIRTLALASLVLAAAACSSGEAAPLADDLSRDLDQARATGLELAPQGDRLQVVSAIERVPAGTAPTTVARAPKAVPRPRNAPAPVAVARPDVSEVAEVAVGEAPAPAVVDAPAPIVTSPRPTAPRATPMPRSGRVWSTADVIRNAPFPVNP